MSNVCTNEIKIRGPRKTVAKLIMDLAATPETLDLTAIVSELQRQGEVSRYSFYRHHVDGEWICDIDRSTYQEVGDESVWSFWAESPSMPPENLFLYLARTYPELTFGVSWFQAQNAIKGYVEYGEGSFLSSWDRQFNSLEDLAASYQGETTNEN